MKHKALATIQDQREDMPLLRGVRAFLKRLDGSIAAVGGVLRCAMVVVFLLEAPPQAGLMVGRIRDGGPPTALGKHATLVETCAESITPSQSSGFNAPRRGGVAEQRTYHGDHVAPLSCLRACQGISILRLPGSCSDKTPVAVVVHE